MDSVADPVPHPDPGTKDPMFLDLPDPLVTSTDPDSTSAPVLPSTSKNSKENLDF